MALAAVQPVMARRPSWDEQIVPALRKRLQSESRELSKRMSAASFSGDESSGPSTPPYIPPAKAPAVAKHIGHGAGAVHSKSSTSSSRSTATTESTTYSTSSKPKAASSASSIPRPSLQLSRKDTNESADKVLQPLASGSGLGEGTSVEVTLAAEDDQPRRKRTYSQPKLFEASLESTPTPSTQQGSKRPSALGTPSQSNSRATSPMPSVTTQSTSTTKPTRIPKVSSTPRSVSSTTLNKRAAHGTGPGSAQINGDTHFNDPLAAPLYQNHNSTHSSISVSRTQRSAPGINGSGLLHEQAPFTSGTDSHPTSYYEDADATYVMPSRPDSADEERPFEHWYRGDLSRNGGVGELRVGNRQEMLEIANYGHRLRERAQPVRKPADVYYAYTPNGRRRANSIDARDSERGDRDSLIMEDVAVTQMVLDEMPLTDIEGDGGFDTETDRETYASHSAWGKRNSIQAAIAAAAQASPSTSMAVDSTSGLPRPRKGSQASRLPQLKTDYRAGSEPPAHPRSHSQPAPHALSASSSPAGPSSSNTTTPTNANPNGNAGNKRARGKSPATPGTPSKKAKSGLAKGAAGKSKSSLDVTSMNSGSGEGSAEYPEPRAQGAGEMADAIPSWTQPKMRDGKWDEVVLPVVARKMGLDDQYEDADGSPRPQKVAQEPPPPAPGTFGFDHSKYRTARRSESPQTHLGAHDEFGNIPEAPEGDDARAKSTEKEPDARRSSTRSPLSIDTSTSLTKHPSYRRRATPPPSPAPFSHYTGRLSTASASAAGDQMKEMKMSMDAQSPQPMRQVEEEDAQSGGCCKCVVM